MRIFSEVEADSGETDSNVMPDAARIRENLEKVRSVIAVASAKGGVGKSTIAVNIAAALASAGRKIGLLDADLNAPSIMSMLGMKTGRKFGLSETLEPFAGPLGLRIASSAMLADGEPPPISFLDEPPPAISNGDYPIELSYRSALRRLFGETRFGALDILLVDLSPGIEPLYRVSRIVPLSGVVLVSHPSDSSVRASRDTLEAVAGVTNTVLGIVENMVGFNCDGCHSVRPLLPQGDLTGLAREFELPILARMPFDPRLAESSDRGLIFVREYPDAPLAKQLIALAQVLDQEAASRQTRPPAA